MPDIKFSDLALKSTVNGDDIIPIIDSSNLLMSEDGSNAIVTFSDFSSSIFDNLNAGSIEISKLETNPVFSGNVTLPDTTSIGDVSANEISYLTGLRNNIQYQLDNPFFPVPGTLTLGPGTVDYAPLKIVAGINRQVPEAGTVEFDGDYLYYTNNDATPARQTLATVAYVNDSITGGGFVNNPTFTGTITSATSTTNSLTQAALRLNGGSGSIILDNGGNKRIGWNDGENLSIRSGNYYTGTAEVYATESGVAAGGAAKIAMTSDGLTTNGVIDLQVAPFGNKDDVVAYSNNVKIATDRFTITGTAVNVGIGTSSPSYKLDVAGRIRILNSGNASELEVGAGTTSSQIASINLVGDTTYNPGLRLHREAAGANANSEMRHRGTGNFNIVAEELSPIRLLTNNAERARIASDGTVFIGNGSAVGSPVAGIISASGGSGPNVEGASLTIRGGASTGDANGGEVIFSTAAKSTTSGSGVNAAVQRARILSAGQTIIGGATSAFTTRFGTVAPTNPLVPNLQILSNTTGSSTEANSSSALIGRFTNNPDGPRLFFTKSRNATTGSHTVINSGDNIGLLSFGGSDGTQIVESARIDVVVDTGTVVNAGSFTIGKRYKILTVGSSATNWVALGAADANPGTVFTCNSTAQTGNGTAYLEPDVNNVPGVISMHTTPVSSGATAPIERLRITSSGNILIGTAIETAGSRLYVDGTTSTASSSHVVSSASIQSGVTTSFNSFSSSPTTAAANFTLPSLRHYNASQGTLGANSKITAQTGYRADSTLIGANANYGFYGDVPNISTPTTAAISNIAATTSAVTITTSANHGFTPNQFVTIASSVSAVNGTFTLVTASGTTLTYALTGSAITSAPATGSITSAGRWNFYANGSAPNYFAGDVSIGTSSGGIISNTNGGNITFRTGTTTISDRLAVNADGSVRLATNPAFNAVGGTQVATTSFVAQSIAAPVIGNPNQPLDARVLTDSDVGKYIRYTGANAVSYTVPSTLTVLSGSVITFRRCTGTPNAGVITLTAGTNVTINDNGASSVAAGKTFSIKCIDTGTIKVWDFIG